MVLLTSRIFYKINHAAKEQNLDGNTDFIEAYEAASKAIYRGAKHDSIKCLAIFGLKRRTMYEIAFEIKVLSKIDSVYQQFKHEAKNILSDEVLNNFEEVQRNLNNGGETLETSKRFQRGEMEKYLD
eukprot:scpid81347/ scgid34998/ 